MANVVVETAKGLGKFKYEVIRGEKKEANKWGKYFFMVKVFSEYTSEQYGLKRDYSVFTGGNTADEYKGTLDIALNAAKRLESNTQSDAGQAVIEAAAATTAASDAKCPI